MTYNRAQRRIPADVPTQTKTNLTLPEIAALVLKEIGKLEDSLGKTSNPVAKKLLKDELDVMKERQSLWDNWSRAAKDIDNLELNYSSKERMKLSLRDMINREIEEKGVFGEKGRSETSYE